MQSVSLGRSDKHNMDTDAKKWWEYDRMKG